MDNNYTHEILQVKTLKPFLARDIRQKTVDDLKERIGAKGYNPAHPLIVTHYNDEYIVAGGNHRLSALQDLAVDKAPCLLYQSVPPILLAMRDNEDESTMADTDLFDWLSYISILKAEGKTQKEIAEEVGWSRTKAQDYLNLSKKIDAKVLNLAKSLQEGRAPKNDAFASFDFTEGWFRTSGLYDLLPVDQETFMDWFIDKKCDAKKAAVQKQTQKLKEYREMKIYAALNLTADKADLKKKLTDIYYSIDNGHVKDKGHLKKLIDAANDEWQQKNRIKILHGDVFEQIQNIEDGSVDLLLTDPPYGVMTDYEWDNFDDYSKFLDDYLTAIKSKLSKEYTGFIFADARQMYGVQSVIAKHFEVKNTLIWIRKNMSKGRGVKDRFISSYEVIFYFGNRALNLPEDWGSERFDSFEYAVPQSNFKEGKYHPTQKPIELIKQLVSVGSFEEETVLDTFAGSGTTGLACKELKRKCYLIEREDEYVKVINARLSVA